MADRIVQLQDKDGNNVFPVSTGGETLPVGSEIEYDGSTVPTGWQEMDSIFKYIESQPTTVTVSANNGSLTAFSDLVTIPSGYTVVSPSLYVTGSGTSVDLVTKFIATNSSLPQSSYAVILQNLNTSTSRTWTFKLGVLCMKTNMIS